MKEKIFQVQEIGSLRKSDWLIKTLRNPNISQEAKKAARDDLAYINIKKMEEAGLDIVYDGEARRTEMYEYAVRNISGFKLTGQIRSWDNKYYRKARVIDKVGYIKPYHLDEYKSVAEIAKKEVKIPITGPYTLADWSYNEFYPKREDLIFDLAKEVINPMLKELVSAGAKIIQLDEPAATTHPNDSKLFVEAFNQSVKGVKAKITVHICYSGDNYTTLFPDILEMKCTQFALEFANRDTSKLGVNRESRHGYSALEAFKEYNDPREIGLGVSDVHVDLIESPEIIRDRILYAEKIWGDPTKIYVNPDCGLRTRSRDVAFTKLSRISKGRDLAKKEINQN